MAVSTPPMSVGISGSYNLSCLKHERSLCQAHPSCMRSPDINKLLALVLRNMQGALCVIQAAMVKKTQQILLM